jgi:hypothetical protein
MVGELGGKGEAASVEAAAGVTPVVEAMQDMPGEEEEEDDLAIAASNAGDNAMKARIAALEAKLAVTAEEKARAVYANGLPLGAYANGLPLGAKIELTQAVADALYPMWRKDNAFLDVIKASIVAPEEAPTQDAPIVLVSAWGASGIGDDSATPAGKYDAAAAKAEAVITAKQNGTKMLDEYRKNLERVEA